MTENKIPKTYILINNELEKVAQSDSITSLRKIGKLSNCTYHIYNLIESNFER